MDDKSIEKTTSALNGHGIAGDDPTIRSQSYVASHIMEAIMMTKIGGSTTARFSYLTLLKLEMDNSSFGGQYHATLGAGASAGMVLAV